jgi:hypothetical protein
LSWSRKGERASAAIASMSRPLAPRSIRRNRAVAGVLRQQQNPLAVDVGDVLATGGLDHLPAQDQLLQQGKAG